MISKLYFTKRINFHRFILFNINNIKSCIWEPSCLLTTYRCFDSPSDEKARTSSGHRLWQLRSQLKDKQAKKTISNILPLTMAQLYFPFFALTSH